MAEIEFGLETAMFTVRLKVKDPDESLRSDADGSSMFVSPTFGGLAN